MPTTIPSTFPITTEGVMCVCVVSDGVICVWCNFLLVLMGGIISVFLVTDGAMCFRLV